MSGPDPQAIADMVAACPDVAALSAGPAGTVATYRPGERIVGIRINDSSVAIHVVGRWGTTIPLLAEEIRACVRPLVDGRGIDVRVEDFSDPEIMPRNKATNR